MPLLKKRRIPAPNKLLPLSQMFKRKGANKQELTAAAAAKRACLLLLCRCATKTAAAKCACLLLLRAATKRRRCR